MDPYLAGALIPFALSSPKTNTFLVHDKHCSLPQLYEVNKLCRTEYKYHKITSIHYSNQASFECDLGYTVQAQTYLDVPSTESFWRYLTGIIDMSSEILKEGAEGADMCIRVYCTVSLLVVILEQVGIPGVIKYTPDGYFLEYSSVHAIDFFGNLIEPSRFKKGEFNLILSAKTILPECVVHIQDTRAVVPKKKKLSDLGEDLYLIERLGATTFDTGIAVNIPIRYYVEIIPNPELLRKGWMISRPIFERSHSGRWTVELVSLRSDSDPISLPFCCGQMVFRRHFFVEIK
jgi:hypothetical protein